jgi:hypothetical protein
MNGAGSGSCPMTDSGIIGVESSRTVTTVSPYMCQCCSLMQLLDSQATVEENKHV